MFLADFISGSRDFTQHLTSGELILIYSAERASWCRLRARVQRKTLSNLLKEKLELILLHVSDCTLFCLLKNLPKHF